MHVVKRISQLFGGGNKILRNVYRNVDGIDDSTFVKYVEGVIHGKRAVVKSSRAPLGIIHKAVALAHRVGMSESVSYGFRSLRIGNHFLGDYYVVSRRSVVREGNCVRAVLKRVIDAVTCVLIAVTGYFTAAVAVNRRHSFN